MMVWCVVMCYFSFFFFQAEDGIRDYKVTGVQTCALPICCRRQAKQRPSFESAKIAGSYPGSPVALDGNHTVIHQHAIARIQAAIALAVHGEFLSADPYVRVAAGHVMVSRGVDLLRTGSAGAVAIRDDNGVGSEGRFDAAEEEVVTAAARGEKERGGEKQDGPGSHGCDHKLLFYTKSRRRK